MRSNAEYRNMLLKSLGGPLLTAEQIDSIGTIITYIKWDTLEFAARQAERPQGNDYTTIQSAKFAQELRTLKQKLI